MSARIPWSKQGVFAESSSCLRPWICGSGLCKRDPSSRWWNHRKAAQTGDKGVAVPLWTCSSSRCCPRSSPSGLTDNTTRRSWRWGKIRPGRRRSWRTTIWTTRPDSTYCSLQRNRDLKHFSLNERHVAVNEAYAQAKASQRATIIAEKSHPRQRNHSGRRDLTAPLSSANLNCFERASSVLDPRSLSLSSRVLHPEKAKFDSSRPRLLVRQSMNGILMGVALVHRLRGISSASCFTQSARESRRAVGCQRSFAIIRRDKNFAHVARSQQVHLDSFPIHGAISRSSYVSSSFRYIAHAKTTARALMRDSTERLEYLHKSLARAALPVLRNLRDFNETLANSWARCGISFRDVRPRSIKSTKDRNARSTQQRPCIKAISISIQSPSSYRARLSALS